MPVTTIKLSDFQPICNLLKLELDGVEVADFAVMEGRETIVLYCLKRYGCDPESYTTTYCCDDGVNHAELWTSGGVSVRLGYKFFEGEWI